MYSNMIAKQIIDFNKATFDNTFDAINILQDHSEKMVHNFLQNTSLFPPEVKKVVTEWMEVYKQGKRDFIKNVNDGFNSIEVFLDNSVNIKSGPIDDTAALEKMNQSINEFAGNIAAKPKEFKNKSIQADETAAEETVKLTSTEKNKTLNDERSVTGMRKTVRRTAKLVKE